MRKSQLIVLLVFLLFLYQLHAECPPDCSSDSSSSSGADYSSNAYYTSSNPIDWDYSQVQWDKVPVDKISEIPADKLEYGKLNSQQRLAMTSDQIVANFNNIQDLTKDVDKTKAQQAIYDKYSLTTDLGNGANLKDGVLTSTYGRKDQLGLGSEGCKGGFVRIEEKGRILFSPSDTAKQLTVSSDDQFTLKNQGKPLTVEVSPGNAVSLGGQVSFTKGQAYVTGGDWAYVNGVQVESASARSKNPQDIKLFFSGESTPSYTKDYVSLGTDKMFCHAADNGGIAVKFSEGNPYIQVDPTDRVWFNVKRNVDFSVENRDSQNLIPLVAVTLARPNGLMNCISGEASFSLEGRRVKALLNSEPSLTSAPMTVTFQTPTGSDILGRDINPKKLVISNYNEMVVMARTQTYTTERLNGNSPAFVSEDLYFNQGFTAPVFVKEFPNVELFMRDDPTVIKRLTDFMNNKEYSPQLRQSIAGFAVYPFIDYRALQGLNSLGFTAEEDSIIRVPDNGINDETLLHEGAHTLTYQYINAHTSVNVQLTALYEQADSLLGTRVTSDTEILEAISKETSVEKKEQLETLVSSLQKLTVPYENSNLEEEWNKKFGGSYEKNIKCVDEKCLDVTWNDGTTGPNDKCITVYACTNFFEHIAVTTEYAYKYPEVLAGLIKKEGNEGYYRQELDYLYQKGFITARTYSNVIILVNKK